MAKQKPSIITISGKFQNVTFVNSPTYGNHPRSNRGTYKEAPVNETLDQNSKRTAPLNNTAGPIFRALDIYTKKTRDKQLWTTMLSLLRNTDTNDPFQLIEAFKNLELHPKHPYQALFMKPPQIITSAHDQDLHVFFDPGRKHPNFREEVTSYRYSLIAIYPSQEDFYPPQKTKAAKKKAKPEDKPISLHDLATTDWISMKSKTANFNFQFTLPPGATHVVLCFLIHAREGLYEIPSLWANRGAILSVEAL